MQILKQKIEEKVEKQQNKRESNLEMLRIIAMIMIIFHHLAVHSEFEFQSNSVCLNKLWIYFILMGGKIGVNIFVLISGYFLINIEKISVTKVLKLWGQIVTISVSIYIILVLLNLQEFNMIIFIKRFFPIINEEWWFATTYFILYLISPFLNILLKSVDEKKYKKMLCFMIICWCIIPTILRKSFQSNSIVWFIVLYSVAAYVRLYGMKWKIDNKGYFLISILLIIITYIIAILTSYNDVVTMIYLYEMQCIFIFLISIFIFLGFKQTNIKYNDFINRIATTTFGIYLIHDSNFIKLFIWKNIFRISFFQESNLLILYSVLVCIILFLGCSLIEIIRSLTIEKYYMKLVYNIESRIKNKNF